MAKKRSESKKPSESRKIGGPFLAAAFFCENILEDLRGMLSVQSISDAFQIMIGPMAPQGFPSKEKPLLVKNQLLLVFRSGDSPGKHKLKLTLESPSGKRSLVKEEEITLSEAPNGGIHIKAAIDMAISSSGLFLMDVHLDGKLMTRVFLNVDIRRSDGSAVVS